MRSYLPFVFFMTGGFTVIIVFCLMRLDLHFLFKIPVFLILAMVGVVFVVFGVQGADLSSTARQLKPVTARWNRDEQQQLSMELQATVRSLTTIKIYVGSFFEFDRQTPLYLCYRIVDALVTLLFSFPVVAFEGSVMRLGQGCHRSNTLWDR